MSCNTNPTMCNPSAGCVQVDGAQAVCTQYFSLTTNIFKVQNYGLFDSDKSFFCASGNMNFQSETCLENALKITSKYPLTCIQSTDCYSSTDQLRTTSCNCYPNTQGVKYCAPFPGDIPEVMEKIKSKIKSNFASCYNFEILMNLNDCGFYSVEDAFDSSPPVKGGTWGSCYETVNLQPYSSVAMSYTGSSYGTCPAIKCLEKGNNAEGFCFAYYSDALLYYVQSCPTDYICGTKQHGDYELTNDDVLCQEVRPKARHHKDESCWVDSDCYSGICGINKYCAAYTKGSSCTSDNQCDKSLICRPSNLGSYAYTCQKWLDIGEQCSTSNYYLCRPSSLCINTKYGDSGTCQGYYSVAGDSTYYSIISTGSIQGTSSKMCQSGAWNPKTNTCFSSPNKLKQYPIMCSTDSDCKSINYQSISTGESDGKCNCFPNTGSYYYCQVFPADIDPDYYSWLSNYYKRTLSDCYSYEIGENYGGNCQLGDRYHDIWYQSIQPTVFPDCGRDVLYSEDRYENFQDKDLIYLYVFSSRLLSFITILFTGFFLVQ